MLDYAETTGAILEKISVFVSKRKDKRHLSVYAADKIRKDVWKKCEFTSFVFRFENMKLSIQTIHQKQVNSMT